MIWATGTGRCGTHSFAVAHKCLHEPNPRMMLEGANHWRAQRRGRISDEEESLWGLVSDALEERQEIVYRDSDAMGIVDCHLAPVIEYINEIDIMPKVVLIWREFDKVWKSQQRRGHQYWEEGYRNWEEFISPPHGWEDGMERVDKAFWYWKNVNLHVVNVIMSFPQSSTRIIHTNQIPVHEFRTPPEDYASNIAVPEEIARDARHIEQFIQYSQEVIDGNSSRLSLLWEE